jgi:hypothetical protein
VALLVKEDIDLYKQVFEPNVTLGCTLVVFEPNVFFEVNYGGGGKGVKEPSHGILRHGCRPWPMGGGAHSPDKV